MWRLQNVLFLLLIALHCGTAVAEVILTAGYEGSKVNISCPYEAGYKTSVKYFCRDLCFSEDVLITSAEGKEKFEEQQQFQKGRYSVYEENDIFTVTISNLTLSDAGMYWCGVTRFGADLYTEVKLDVKPDWCCVKSQDVSGSVGHPVTLQCPYPPRHVSNRKFFCKGERRTSCRNMVESQSQADLRFTLQDNAASSSFSVTIVKLEVSDTGTYWCGSDSEWRPGNYAKIQLSVVFPQKHSTATSVTTVGPETSGQPANDFTALSIVVHAGPVVPLIIALALVTVCKYKRSKKKGTEVDENRNLAAAETGDASIQNNGGDEYQDVLCLNLEQLNTLYHNEDQPENLYENISTNE